MFKFSVKISVLPPDAKISNHPLYNESEIIFNFENCSLSDAINCALEHQEYIDFIERNKICGEVYVYYTDVSGNWHCYNND